MTGITQGMSLLETGDLCQAAREGHETYGANGLAPRCVPRPPPPAGPACASMAARPRAASGTAPAAR